MEKILMALLLVIVSFSSSISAEELMMVNNLTGEIKLVREEESQWRFPTTEERMALKKPGVEILGDARVISITKKDFFHRRSLVEYPNRTLWDGKKFQKAKGLSAETSDRFDPNILVFFLAIILAMTSYMTFSFAKRKGAERKILIGNIGLAGALANISLMTITLAIVLLTIVSASTTFVFSGLAKFSNGMFLGVILFSFCILISCFSLGLNRKAEKETGRISFNIKAFFTLSTVYILTWAFL